MCTLFNVDALARAGRLTEAELTFQKMFTYANHLGLYFEEIGLTGGQLGNFPRPSATWPSSAPSTWTISSSTAPETWQLPGSARWSQTCLNSYGRMHDRSG
jgi:hypothetical protein